MVISFVVCANKVLVSSSIGVALFVKPCKARRRVGSPGSGMPIWW